MTIEERLKFWLYKMIEPFFRKLQFAVKVHARQLANQEVYAEGIKLWKEFRERRRSSTGHIDPYRPPFVRHADRVANCTHLKGGSVRGFIGKDYNVSLHTFSDSTSRIKCLGSCGRVWRPSDPDWYDALKMVESSTNTPTSSEIPLIWEKK